MDREKDLQKEKKPSAVQSRLVMEESAPAAKHREDAGAAQNTPPAAPAKAELQKKRETDTAYAELVEEADALYAAVRGQGTLELSAFDTVCRHIWNDFELLDRAVLFESQNVLRSRRTYHAGHAVNVALLNIMFAEKLNLSRQEKNRLVRVGLGLDLGMMTLSPRLLDDTRKLDEKDLAELRTHPLRSAELLRAAGERDGAVLEAVAQHHERYDGSGYPNGLRGDESPLLARISAVADTFDAATSRRKFRQRRSPFSVLAEFAENPGQRLDPEITRAAIDSLVNVLLGRYVTLSDHSMGLVTDIRPENISYPEVRVVGHYIQTGPQLYPVALSGYLPLF